MASELGLPCLPMALLIKINNLLLSELMLVPHFFDYTTGVLLQNNLKDLEPSFKVGSWSFEGIISLLIYYLNCRKALFTKKQAHFCKKV